MTPSTKPSSNWFSLQKTLVQHGHPRKWRKIDRGESSVSFSNKVSGDAPSVPLQQHESNNQNEDVDLKTTEVKNGESIAALRRMVLGKVEYSSGSQTAPGKYLALDCEMVGVGIEGSESSLARVSLVNYNGAVILDVFVRQREKVVDYRTQWSGIRSNDLVGSAKPFKEVQEMVAELIKDRILVGHALYNDLKALLLSHPFLQIRDTQSLAYKHRTVKSRRPALRVLVKQELGILIQGGEHSSVIDARATMALFRLHKKQWESGFRSRNIVRSRTKDKITDDPASKTIGHMSPSPNSLVTGTRKRGRSELSQVDDDWDEAAEASSSSRRHSPSPSSASCILTPHVSNSPKRRQRKRGSAPSADLTLRNGISSGILTVTRRADGTKEVRRQGMQRPNSAAKGNVSNGLKGGRKIAEAGEKWWKTLGGGKKGDIKL